MATEVQCEVDTGLTGDYPSHNAAETDDYGATSWDLVSVNEWVNCRLRATDGTRDTAGVVIDAKTTDSTRYIKVWTDLADQGGDGVDGSFRHQATFPAAGAKVYAMETTGTSVDIQVNYTQVYGIAAKTAYASSARCFHPRAVGVELAYCLGTFTGAWPSAGWGIALRTANGVMKVYGNIIYDCVGHANNGGIQTNYPGASSVWYIYANTVINCPYGIRRYDSTNTVVVTNNVVFGCTDAFYGTFSAGSKYNAYSEGTDPGTNGIDISGYTGAQLFTDYAGKIFKVSETSPLKDAGYDISTDPNCPVTQDFAGTARPQNSVFDLGAHEYEAEAPPAPPADYVAGMVQAGHDTLEDDEMYDFDYETFRMMWRGSKLPPPVRGSKLPKPVQGGRLPPPVGL